MKATVNEQGILIPKKYLKGAHEVDILVERGLVIVTPITTDPIKQLGKHPVTIDINDASKEHDKYIYHP